MKDNYIWVVEVKTPFGNWQQRDYFHSRSDARWEQKVYYEKETSRVVKIHSTREMNTKHILAAQCYSKNNIRHNNEN